MGVILAALGGAAAALLLVGLLAALRRGRTRADLGAMLDAAQREADDLRAQLDELTLARDSTLAHENRVTVPRPRPAGDAPAFLITDAGAATGVPVEQVRVPDRLVLSATVGAPLVKVAAFSHGVRRALSPQSRNRIWFEMRREVRASRKRRLQLLKQYKRDLRAEGRAAENRAQEGLA